MLTSADAKTGLPGGAGGPVGVPPLVPRLVVIAWCGSSCMGFQEANLPSAVINDPARADGAQRTNCVCPSGSCVTKPQLFGVPPPARRRVGGSREPVPPCSRSKHQL